ncbi:uncharacterized protein M6B38_389070 [Iris pallida]|uniref:Uncharacterized protein n=1 Tax=Iris pallida TaxID=29817 RepID=A0AAX6G214_IRIPA|nr:uncharacterized protein M6B38_109930 [Iris pallida]KAJ6822375.1 uncharacterized protein M6B38_389070 [Iris pallida]
MDSFSACEEMRAPLVCPRPRRIGSGTVDPIRLHQWQTSHQADPLSLRPGVELLDIFLSEDSSPPFFCGSPPARSANPLIHDVQFRQVDTNPHPPPPSSPAPASVKGCSTWTKFGFAPAPVRVEGFDCGRSRSRGIPAFA